MKKKKSFVSPPGGKPTFQLRATETKHLKFWVDEQRGCSTQNASEKIPFRNHMLVQVISSVSQTFYLGCF